jgi:hypothetical protein
MAQRTENKGATVDREGVKNISKLCYVIIEWSFTPLLENQMGFQPHKSDFNYSQEKGFHKEDAVVYWDD